jgi:DNA replication protein DnaC
MTAFLKIDDCTNCRRNLPWEWVPAYLLNGKPLAGTGVWRSQLLDGICPACVASLAREREEKQRALVLRKELIELLGGEKPYREFTYDRFQATPGNQLAFERCSHFDPVTENLYLWGSCGVGKTHLGYATARRCFDETLSVVILPAGQLTRRARMKDPDQEQAIIDQWVRADALVLDDLGSGPDTAYRLQLWQEILDARDFRDRAGILVTSKYDLSALAQKLGDDSIPSRLAGMCRVIEVKGADRRLSRSQEL